jgi:hypothetical protein
MIKATVHTPDGPILMLGLSRENMTRLLDDKPIFIGRSELTAMGVSTDTAIAIIGGETEAAMAKQLGALPL